MGLTRTFLEISRDLSMQKKKRIDFLVDSGAEYSVAPSGALKELGISPQRRIEIILADGSILERDAGEAVFEYLGTRATSPVLFGEPEDEPLLGAVTLETLGCFLDPLRRRILKRTQFRM